MHIDALCLSLFRFAIRKIMLLEFRSVVCALVLLVLHLWDLLMFLMVLQPVPGELPVAELHT